MRRTTAADTIVLGLRKSSDWLSTRSAPSATLLVQPLIDLHDTTCHLQYIFVIKLMAQFHIVLQRPSTTGLSEHCYILRSIYPD